MSTAPEPSVASAVPLTGAAQRAGWWHAYVCPVHHVELDDPGSQERAVHRCRHGCELTGESYDGASRVYRYQALARRLRLLARRAGEGDAAARSEATALAAALLDLHEQVAAGDWSEDAADWMLRGKLFHQALTEAIWTTNVAHGLLTLRELEATDDQLEPRIRRFARSTVALVDEARRVLVDDRDDFNSNYTAWLNAAGASAAALVDGHVGRAPWLEGPHGQFRHVLAATTSDGWEWERATYYHVFVLRAYLLSLRGLPAAHVPEPVRDRLARMLAVLPAVAAPGGRLPALQDSPYDRRVSHEELLEAVALGTQLVTVPGLGPLVEAARRALGDRDDGLDRRLTGWIPGGPSAPPRPITARGRSHRFDDAGYVVLHSPDGRWRALLDLGPHGGSHGHFAKLALYVESEAAWQPDAGITPYGSGMRTHYAGTAAHPTFAVPGVDQAACSGRLERFEVTDDATTVAATCDEAYTGVGARRTLHLTAGWLLDVVDLTADLPTDLQLQVRPAVAVELHADGGGGWSADWRDPAGDLRTLHRSDTDALVRPVSLPGPADDPMRHVTGVDWRTTAAAVRFATVWQPAGAVDPVADVRVRPDAVDVVTSTGTTTVPVTARPPLEPPR